MKISDLKLAVKCCTCESDKWENTCGSCPFNDGAKSFEEISEGRVCIDELLNALAEYLPEEEPDDPNNN